MSSSTSTTVPRFPSWPKVVPSARAVGAALRRRLRELLLFGLVGAVSFVVDVTVFNLLLPHGSLKAKAVSTVTATVVAYLGNRHLTFGAQARDCEHTASRQWLRFFVINLLLFLFSEAVLAVTAYPLGRHADAVVMNVVNVATIAVGTVARYWVYKRHVFTAAAPTPVGVTV